MKSEEKKMEQMKDLMVRQQSGQSQMNDPMEAMIDVMVQSCKLNDEIFFEHGIEEEDFNAAVLHFKLQEDPEVRALIMRSMQMMGMGGPQGGMGGMFGQ